MRNKTVMKHAFSMVPNIAKPRSVFDRSHGYSTTLDADGLVPIYFKNVMPGDSITLKHSVLMRMNSPLIRPCMDNIYVSTYYFFVPYRLVWSNFVKFMGEQANPADSISYTIPQCTGPNVASSGIALGSLHDYFGLPTEALSGGGGTTGITFNNLFPRSYNLIWNQWFRDENLQNSVTVDLGDGPDTYSNYVLLKRGKKHDYFTSCLPFLQKGTAVSIPLGTTATVKTFGTDLYTGAQNAMNILQTDGSNPTANRYVMTGTNPNQLQGATTGPTSVGNYFYPSNLYADLSTATAATINTLRQSIALQQFLENDARGGTRYTEIVRQRWGVTSPDARLQRAELLSLSRDPIKINPVANTAANEAVPSTFPWLGQMGAAVNAGVVGHGFTKSFTEHGCIIGMVCVDADLRYAQGQERHWSYRTRYDLPNPEFYSLGEQAILNREIYANVPDGTSSSQKDGVFGYQERYAEERYSNSLVTGLMRPQATGTLAVWNFTEKFTSLPTLGSTFIQSSASGPIDRDISVPSEPQFILDAYFDEKWARVMPMYSVPGLRRL